MSKKGLYFSGVIAFLLLSFIVTKFFYKGDVLSPYLNPQPTAITVFPTSFISPTLYPSPRPTSPSESGSCCSIDKKLQGWICVTATCVGVPYSEQGEKVEKCVPPNQTNQYNLCPLKCLSSSTSILTKKGKVNIKNLRIGDLIWTVNKKGLRELQPIVKLSQIEVGTTHQMVHLILSDGRKLDVSPNHPSAVGSLVGQLKEGDKYDGSIIEKSETITYRDTRTYDLLPAGETGFYYANGILMGSTLH